MGEAERPARGPVETETFARLMRELKERGGLSYGSLARRLHTSTSTLHRYCNGEAVPAEFAVLDRFARACGASREQAVELHRAWLLADARRRSAAHPEHEPVRGPERGPERDRAAEAASVVGSGAEPGAVPGAETGAGPGEAPVGEPGAETGPVPKGPSGPVLDPAPGESPGAGPESITGTPSAAVPAPGAGPEALPGPAAAPVRDAVPGAVRATASASGSGSGNGAVVVVGAGAVPGAGGAGGGRRAWYRRRGVAVAAAGVTAAAVVAGVLAAAGPERRHAQAGPTGDQAAVSPSQPRTPASGGPPVPSPSASAPPAAAPPASSPSPSASAPPAAAPAPAPTPPTAAVAPLRTAVRSHVWAAGCEHAYLSERTPAQMPPPPVEADAPAWAQAQQAVHAGSQTVEITVHGTGEGAVVLQDLDVRVTARRTPPAWNVYQMSQGCGGALTPAAFAVNLDAPRPQARPVAGNDGGDRIPAPAFPLRVSAGEPAVLRVVAAATGCDCEWYLDLRWTGPGGSGTLRLDENGRPWRTSATAGRPEYGFASELGRWAK
ncbi:helix-turn-helix domain-containing protein [Streptomyces sp. NPDC006512]|uniref:helix-turn-helix domain-containing protein n=1 Tax=Streptomyces sp. NPDC006512 TaxID=3154307 RepID=UPI0033BC0359